MPSPSTSSVAVIHTSLVNASLGVGLALHSMSHASGVLAAVSFPPGLGSPATADEYLRAFEDACHGSKGPHPLNPLVTLRPGSHYLFQTDLAPDCLDSIRHGFVSQVVGWHSLYGALSDDDKIRFGFLTDDPPNAGDPIWDRMMSIRAADRANRRFKPHPTSAWLCKPVHWWTPREGVDVLLQSISPKKRADTLRDVLGLYYSEYDGRGTVAARKRNMRFVFHVPVNMLIRRSHFRPNFADAGGYCRFVTHCLISVPPTPFEWGQTANLAELAKTGSLTGGLPERISPRFDVDDFENTDVWFDYLGEITHARGQGSTDNNIAFEKTLHALHETIFPHLSSGLSTMTATLPAMVP